MAQDAGQAAAAPTDDPLLRARQALAAKRFGEAEGICRDLLGSDPQNADALGILGTLFGQLGRVQNAVALYERALALRPNNGVWLGNLSELYRLVYRIDDALAAALRALQLNPPAALNLVRLAKIRTDRGEFDAALQSFLAALALDPEDANAHLGIGQILLARGEYRPGWIEYEWRNKLPQAKQMVPRMKAPLWNGMALPNARVLLVGDQGYGDVIHFARYIPRVVERCKEVVIGCSADLQPLLARVPGVAGCFHRWQEAPTFTAYMLLSSLPYLFGTDTQSIPGEVPYLSLDPEKVAKWRTRLGELCGEGVRKVGLFWAGRAAHPNNLRRSMRLAALQPLGGIDGIRFLSLQKEVPPADGPDLAAFPGMVDISADLANFDETAAVIGNLDLLITVDSAVAHLAGALNRPVWMLTPRPSDWRWMLERADSPWYPSLRLFRQPRPGAWAEVVEAVRLELAAFASAGTL
ncbi:MAG: glycosyltransferase family protein [Alphaproteobacteria bacterium]|nr:glycosyltransferase family protein [Alphaproteobacteria bacterium]